MAQDRKLFSSESNASHVSAEPTSFSQEVEGHIAAGGWCDRNIPATVSYDDIESANLRKRDYDFLICCISYEKMQKPVLYGNILCDISTITKDGKLLERFRIHSVTKKPFTENQLRVPDQTTLSAIIEIYAEVQAAKLNPPVVQKEVVLPKLAPIASPSHAVAAPAPRLEIDEATLSSMLYDEARVLSSLMNVKVKFNAQGLLRIAAKFPALGLIILKNVHLRCELSNEQLLSLPVLDARKGMLTEITEYLFENFAEYGLTLRELKALAIKFASIHYMDMSLPLLNIAILLLEQHTENHLLEDKEILSLVNARCVSIFLCNQSEKYQHIILNLTEDQFLKLLTRYRVHSSYAEYDKLIKMPAISSKIKELDGAALTEMFIESYGNNTQSLSKFIFENEGLLAKISGPHVIPFLSKLGPQSIESPLFNQAQSMFSSLSIADMKPVDFYKYAILAKTYNQEDLDAKLIQMAVIIGETDAIRFMSVKDIIELAKMSDFLNENICAAICRVDRYIDQEGKSQFAFKLPQIDELILSIPASPQSQLAFIEFLKTKMNWKIVDGNLGKKSYVHAVATIELFLTRNPSQDMGATARLVIFNLCSEMPQIVAHLKDNALPVYAKLEEILTLDQRVTLKMSAPRAAPASVQGNSLFQQRKGGDDAGKQDNKCSIM